jgi:acyl carrier protein
MANRLSLFQESIWFFQLLDPDTGSFNVARAWTLRGSIEPIALQSALDRVTARHDILRSKVVIDDGFSYLDVIPERRAVCRITDLFEHDPATASARASSFLEDEFSRQFDFEREPLVRAHLVRLSPDESILMIVKPHLITDIASLSIFIAELGKLYSAIRLGEDAHLPAPPQFAAYAERQRAFSYGPQVEAHLAFWCQLLAGAPASLRLPERAASIVGPVRPYSGGEAQFSLSPGLLEQLNTMRRRQGATLYGVCLAAFAVLLHRICDQDDIVIGGLVANRVKPSTRSIIGPLVNTFALRFRFAEIATFRELLDVARKLVTGAYRYCDLPFERVIEKLKAAQQLDPTFRLNAVFDYFASPPAMPQFHGAVATPFHVRRNRAQASITLKVWPDASGMAVAFEYQLAHFGDTEIAHAFALYEAILTEMAQAPQAELRLISVPADLVSTLGRSRESREPVADVPASFPARFSSSGVNEVQSIVLSIWSKAFRIEDVSRQDGFFQLGGHSLLAVEIVNRIADQLGVEVPVEMLLTHTATVQVLSEYVFAQGRDR